MPAKGAQMTRQWKVCRDRSVGRDKGSWGLPRRSDLRSQREGGENVTRTHSAVRVRVAPSVRLSSLRGTMTNGSTSKAIFRSASTFVSAAKRASLLPTSKRSPTSRCKQKNGRSGGSDASASRLNRLRAYGAQVEEEARKCESQCACSSCIFVPLLPPVWAAFAAHEVDALPALVFF